MGCGASANIEIDPLPASPDVNMAVMPTAGDTSFTVDAETTDAMKDLMAGCGIRIMVKTLDTKPKTWMRISGPNGGTLPLWINNISPLNPSQLRLRLDPASGQPENPPKSFAEGKIDEEFEIREAAPVDGHWPEDPFASTWPELKLGTKSQWKSSPQTPQDMYRYLWYYSRQVEVKSDISGESKTAFSLAVKVAGATRVLCSESSSSVQEAEKSNKSKWQYFPVMASVNIELKREGGGEMQVDTGGDGWNACTVSEEPKNLSDFGRPQTNKVFSCRLFDATVSAQRPDWEKDWVAGRTPEWKKQRCRIQVKSGFPEVHSIFVATVLAFGMHPSMMMDMMNKRVMEKCNGNDWEYSPKDKPDTASGGGGGFSRWDVKHAPVTPLPPGM